MFPSNTWKLKKKNYFCGTRQNFNKACVSPSLKAGMSKFRTAHNVHLSQRKKKKSQNWKVSKSCIGSSFFWIFGFSKIKYYLFCSWTPKENSLFVTSTLLPEERFSASQPTIMDQLASRIWMQSWRMRISVLWMIPWQILLLMTVILIMGKAKSTPEFCPLPN